MDEHWVEAVYGMLARMGVNPSDLDVNHVEGDEDDPEAGRVVLALPETEVGLGVDGDHVTPLVDDGWYVEISDVNQLEVFASVYRKLASLAQEHLRRRSSRSMVKTGSRDEDRLLAALLRAGLPLPDRNHRIDRENGKELTTPDFVWEHLRIAFFVDGLWWHVGQDDKWKMEALRDMAGDEGLQKSVLDDSRVRSQRDADIRSDLQVMGWYTLACADADLKTDEGVQRQVERVQELFRKVKREGVREPDPEPVDGSGQDDDLGGLLSAFD